MVMVMNAILRFWRKGVKVWAKTWAKVNMDTGGLAISGERLLQHSSLEDNNRNDLRHTTAGCT